MHSSIDLEAIVAEQTRLQDKVEMDMSESADRVLERLRRRIGQLYGTTGYDHTLSRLGLALITLEACVSRLNQSERAISESPSLIAIIYEIEKSCTTIERNAGLKKRDETVAQWSALTKLIEAKSEKDAKHLSHIDDHLSQMRKAIDRGVSVEKEQFEKISEQLVALRETNHSENRKLVASLAAIHATIERCIDRLSRVEYSLMEARSIETSSAIAEWPQGMQSVNLSLSDVGEEMAHTIDPRRALAAARAAAARAFSRTEQGRN
ncbi:MAG: hypothetical protein WCO61_01350 [Alphaproteobacteria bacterium]